MKALNRSVRIHSLLLQTYHLMADELKLSAVRKRLNAALNHLKHRHQKRADVQLMMALALIRGL